MRKELNFSSLSLILGFIQGVIITYIIINIIYKKS